MALLTFALLAIFAASSASAGPVAVDNATLLLNGQQALVLNCQFQSLQLNDPCNNGDTACIQGATATCVNGTFQTAQCQSGKSCFALPQVRTNGTFVACTSPNNAASIIAATGIQTDIANNCTSLGNTSFPFSAPNNTISGNCGNNSTQGINGTSSAPGQAVPPTSASGSNSPSVPSNAPGSVGNSDGALPVIHLNSAPVSSPTSTPTPTPFSVGNPPDRGY